MEALRQEIRDEMKTLRINKKHVYGLLMRLVDELDSTPAPAPAKKAEPAPAKKAEPAPAKKAEPAPAPVEETPKPVKKVVRRTKKKVEEGETVLK